jgi:hypothetical protein
MPATRFRSRALWAATILLRGFQTLRPQRQNKAGGGRGRPEIVEHLGAAEKGGNRCPGCPGHQATDALLAAMLHQSFLLGSLYELDMFGPSRNDSEPQQVPRSSTSRSSCDDYGEIAEDATNAFSQPHTACCLLPTAQPVHESVRTLHLFHRSGHSSNDVIDRSGAQAVSG